jgi:hypothetical protein
MEVIEALNDFLDEVGKSAVPDLELMAKKGYQN